MTHEPVQTGTVDLAKEAIAHAGDLVRSEIALAKDDIRTAAIEASVSAAAVGVAMLSGFLGLQALLFAVALANRRHPGRTAALGFGLLGVAGAAGIVGIATLPRNPARAIEARLESDVEAIGDKLS